MRIRRLFSVSMLSVTALVVILGAEVLVPQYRTVASKTEAIKAVEAFGAVLVVGQSMAGQRGPFVLPLFQNSAATPAWCQRDRICVLAGVLGGEVAVQRKQSAQAGG